MKKKKWNFLNKKEKKEYLEALSAQREGGLTINSLIFPTGPRSASFLPTMALKINPSF